VEFIESLYERILKEFLDIIILAKAKDSEVTGYELTGFLHEEFDSTISPGTIYAAIYAMERKGLIEATEVDKRRIYRLTQKGSENFQQVTTSADELCKFFRQLLTVGSRINKKQK
jgi:DNA-binding PadR family transcriptional regulator